MRMKDEHIQKKLVELEATLLKEAKDEISKPSRQGNDSLSEIRNEVPSLRSQSDLNPVQKSDLQYFGGIAMIMVSIFLLFQHVKVTSGYAAMWGFGTSGGIGYLLLPLLLGIGWVFYNSKSIWGWLITIVSVFMFVFSIISGLRMYFAPITMIDLIIMLTPLALGAAWVLKGMGGPQGVDEAIRKQIARKN